MKGIYIFAILLFTVLLYSCKQEIKLLGHWKCDGTGTMTVDYRGKDTTGLVTEFYDGIGVEPMEIEFRDDGIAIWHKSLNRISKIKRWTRLRQYENRNRQINT